MIIISHRGNLYGPDKTRENTVDSINECLSLGFDVELDVWAHGQHVFLGHDKPTIQIESSFLKNEKLWCHAKNLDSLYFMIEHDINCFWHENDKYTITNRNIIWTFPNNTLTKRSVCVLPETQKVEIDELKKIHAICTDYCLKYKSMIDSIRM